jgi:hypothetical protein
MAMVPKRLKSGNSPEIVLKNAISVLEMAFLFSVYPIDYEKVSHKKVLKHPFSFSFFRQLAKFSLGGIKLIIIFAHAKRIRV